jgi:hypothetical protein
MVRLIDLIKRNATAGQSPNDNFTVEADLLLLSVRIQPYSILLYGYLVEKEEAKTPVILRSNSTVDIKPLSLYHIKYNVITKLVYEIAEKQYDGLTYRGKYVMGAIRRIGLSLRLIDEDGNRYYLSNNELMSARMTEPGYEFLDNDIVLYVDSADSPSGRKILAGWIPVQHALRDGVITENELGKINIPELDNNNGEEARPEPTGDLEEIISGLEHAGATVDIQKLHEATGKSVDEIAETL